MQLSGFLNTINPLEEVLSYEVLWALDGMTETKMTNLFSDGHQLPSKVLENRYPQSLVPDEDLVTLKSDVTEFIQKKIGSFSVCINGDFQYPKDLRRAKHPIELFYYKGNLDLLNSKSISVVGAREVTESGRIRAERLARELCQAGFIIVSGLAKGVDTAALTSAIKSGGKTIAVIGTPIDKHYPKENVDLQKFIAEDNLLISQVPFYRYEIEPFTSHKHYFPRRNATMAAISEATVIVEASDTSGTLTQARACIQQGKKLFILDSCFKNNNITWPSHYEKLGAIRVSSTDDILTNLNSTAIKQLQSGV
jgi:DNA processing protein